MRHLLTLTLWLITYSLFAQYAELGEIRQACDGYGGSVEIIFIGEGPIADYTYAWSHSSSQDLTLENLPVGEYEFYIQDRFGCSQTILFEITDPFICKPVFTSKWISQKCVYRVVVDFQTIEGVSINPSSFDVVWNYGNLVGSTVVLTFPTTSQQVLELCATYSLVNGEGNSCCSGTACVTLKRPTIIKPCYDPGCTLVVNEGNRPTNHTLPTPTTGRSFAPNKAKTMRHTPAAIRQFLTKQPLSGQTITAFCDDHDLKVPTFYSWKKKYDQTEVPVREGFCKIMPKRETTERSLRLPSGLRLELVGLSIMEIAELILEIDRAHA